MHITLYQAFYNPLQLKLLHNTKAPLETSKAEERKDVNQSCLKLHAMLEIFSLLNCKIKRRLCTYNTAG